MGGTHGARPAVDTQAALEILRQLAAEVHPPGPTRVTLDSRLEEDLGLDSLARVELLARCEQRFHVTVPEHELVRAETARDLMRVLATAGVPARAPARTPRATLPGNVAAPEQAQTLLDVLDAHAHTAPTRTHIYLLDESLNEHEITYATLRDGAAAVAGGLQQRGIAPGQTIALMLPTGADYFSAFFGALRAGAIPVPIYPPTRPAQLEEHLRRHARILDNAQAALLITVPEARPLAWLFRSLAPSVRQVLTVEQLRAAAPAPEAAAIRAQDIAFLQYTSGSTGDPKGVILTHANLLASIRAMGGVIRASAHDCFASWMPLYHDMGLIGAWFGSLYYGMPLVVMSPLTFLLRPQEWLWAIHRHRATLSGAPNFGYELCVRRIAERDLDGLDLSHWRLAFNGAEPVSAETIRRFSERFARYGFRAEAMYPVYGLAECTLGLTFPAPGSAPRVDRIERDAFARRGQALPATRRSHALRFVGCGQPLPGHELRIVDVAGLEAPERREGRVQFKGPAATCGYYRNPQQTAALFDGDWLDSGDLGYVADGELCVTGRVKDIIIRAGRNIYPHELEEAIGDIADMRRGCVAVFSARGAEAERLVVVAETRLTDGPARARLRAAIEAAVIDRAGSAPDEIVLARPHTVLKTSSGKLRRSAVRDLFEQNRLERGHAPPWWQVLRLARAAIVPQLRRARHIAGELLYGAYAWGAFWLLAPPVWTAVACLPRPAASWRVVHAGARLLLWLTRTPLRVRGLEHLPRGPYVLVANHASYVDGIVLSAVLPGAVTFVAKSEFTRNFIARVFLRHLGTEFVERFDPETSAHDAEHLAQTARQHRTLAMFPEGTFQRAPGLLPFHLGAFVAATQTRLPVVPVALRGTRALLRSDQWLPHRSAISVTVGKPVAARGRDWKAAVRLRDATRAAILRHSGEPDLAAMPPA